MKYIFAIDETGNFYSDNWSSVCGVLVKGNELGLKQAYQNIYKEFGFAEPVPNDVNGLLQTNEDIKDKARFHFNKMKDSQKAILKNHLLPFVDKLFISQGKPSLFANNQSWWLIATTVVIREFLRNCKLEKGDEVEILMDCRDAKVFGVVDGTDFKAYHNNIKQQIENNVKRFIPNNSLRIEFKSDTSSFFVNLADVCCGIKNSEEVKDRLVLCDCKSMNEIIDPVVYKDKNPFVALCAVIQEVENKNFRNIGYTEEILKRLRGIEDDYFKVWDVFYDFVKQQIAEREFDSALVSVRGFVDIFLNEFNKSGKGKVKTDKCLDLMVLFVEYFSHIGALSSPFSRKDIEEVLQRTDRNSETRVLRKWEKLISFSLRESQIYFNAYNFSTANDSLNVLWERHEKVVNMLGECFDKKDEPTTALLGSLAQSFAFNGDFDNAVDYFVLSKDYAIKSTATTDSYLFNIYHKEKNIEQCRVLFEQIAEKTAENYAKDKDFKDSWTLIAYCKLRALELYVNKKTNLPAIDLCALGNYNSEYPFPMVMKWEGVALYLEDKEGNKKTIEKYFSEAIGNLLNETNEFVIKTLALPIIQCYALINNQNPYHSKYNTFLRELKDSSKYFENYVNQTSPLLNDIKNDKGIWERALSLPFYYA